MPALHTVWPREEHTLAFNLNCKIPFGQIHMRRPLLLSAGERQTLSEKSIRID
jgi:hypothetical protein